MKSLKYSLISQLEAIDACHYAMLNCANFQRHLGPRIIVIN